MSGIRIYSEGGRGAENLLTNFTYFFQFQFFPRIQERGGGHAYLVPPVLKNVGFMITSICP
jgi:hypothetical protein